MDATSHSQSELALYSTAMWKGLIWFLATVTVTVSAQVTADAPPFTADEIAIYSDFLLHYPEQLSNMIGMQDTIRKAVWDGELQLLPVSGT